MRHVDLIHDLGERQVWVRDLADPIRVDSSNPEDPMAQLAMVLLALFPQMEGTDSFKRSPRPRAARRGGRYRSTRTGPREPSACSRLSRYEASI